MQAGQWKGTILYFPTVLRDQGPAVGEKGKTEVGRYPNMPLEYVTFYEWDETGMLRVNSVLPSSSLLVAGRREDWDLFQPSVTVGLSSWGLISSWGGCLHGIKIWSISWCYQALVWVTHLSSGFSELLRKEKPLYFLLLEIVCILIQIHMAFIFFFFSLPVAIRKVHFQHFYFLQGYLMRCSRERRPEGCFTGQYSGKPRLPTLTHEI